MQNLPAAYLSDLATQIGFLSAFLGGIAATLLALLLSPQQTRPIVGVAAVLSAVAAVSFIVAVIATTYLFAVLHPQAPANVSTQSARNLSRALAFLSFGVGVYTLLGCIGVAGWIRSRKVGMATAVIAAIGAVLVTLSLMAT